MTDNQFKVSHPKTLKGNSTHTLPPLPSPPLSSPHPPPLSHNWDLFVSSLPYFLNFYGLSCQTPLFYVFVDLTVHNVQQHS